MKRETNQSLQQKNVAAAKRGKTRLGLYFRLADV